tara:strand:- start:13 stop:387 length:375 start_codon:yes stop_codon:yes gene_type:complete
MAFATLTFSAPINASCQVGDTAYYVNTLNSSGGFQVASTITVTEIGEIREINNPSSTSPTMKVETTVGYADLNGLTDKYILFNKDNKANLSSPTGYYASVKLVNDSTTTAELYSVTMDTFTSSK